MSDLKIILKDAINNIPYQFDDWDSRYWGEDGYIDQIRNTFIALRVQGTSKHDLILALRALKDEFNGVEDFKAELILEQLSFLEGFCSPHMRID